MLARQRLILCCFHYKQKNLKELTKLYKANAMSCYKQTQIDLDKSKNKAMEQSEDRKNITVVI